MTSRRATRVNDGSKPGTTANYSAAPIERRQPFSWQDFAALASSELRAPLALIHGYIETLQEDMFRKAASLQRCLEVMDKHSRRMMRILEDMQTLARMVGPHNDESRQEVFHAHRTVDDALEHLSPLIDLLQPDIHRQFPKDDLVTGDRRLWDIIMVHLLETALARNASEKITIDIQCTRHGDDFHVIISDTGIGFPPEELPNVFQPFHHPRNDATDKFRGSGLGLAMVERAVALQGGCISVTSLPGQQTTFSMLLPATLEAGVKRRQCELGVC